MWSTVVFVGILLLLNSINSQSWVICGDGLEVSYPFAFCTNTNNTRPWYGYEYMSQYSQDVYYQIQVKSFKDGDGDGVGDLNGIIEKLGYLQELGVDGIILSPILKTSANDVNYEVQDFMTIEPSIGTEEDFKKLLEKAAKLDIKIIINFVPNHTSVLHEWFQLSANRTEGFTDFYVWQKCPLEDGNRMFPNNWISVYNTPAWTYHEGRGECYLHQFSPQQPDLNFRNPLVYQKMLDILKYWIEEGVSGFKLDAVNQLFETQGFPDEKYVNESADKTRHENLVHTHTKNRLESYQFIYDAREMMDQLAFNDDRKVKIIIVEVSDATVDQKALWSGLDETHFGAHVTMNFELFDHLQIDEQQNFTENSYSLARMINVYESKLNPDFTIANWALGGPDKSRLASTHPIHHEHMAIMSMMFPGTNVFYYGAEIGMTDNLQIPIKVEADFRRVRTPFQWDGTRFAGFSNTTDQTWLPIETNKVFVNLKAQKNDDQSTFKMYQKLIELRKEKEVLRIGRAVVNVLLNETRPILCVERRFEQYASILTIINLEGNFVHTSLWEFLPRAYYPTKTNATVLFTRKNNSLVAGEPMENVEANFELGPYATVIIQVNSTTKVVLSLLLLLFSFLTQILS